MSNDPYESKTLFRSSWEEDGHAFSGVQAEIETDRETDSWVAFDLTIATGYVRCGFWFDSTGLAGEAAKKIAQLEDVAKAAGLLAAEARQRLGIPEPSE